MYEKCLVPKSDERLEQINQFVILSLLHIPLSIHHITLLNTHHYVHEIGEKLLFKIERWLSCPECLQNFPCHRVKS